MKVIFEGTLKEIQEEIALFRTWTPKKEVEEHLTDTEKFLDSWNNCRDSIRNLIEHLYHYEYLPLERVTAITSCNNHALGGMISSGTKQAIRNNIPKPVIKYIVNEERLYKISSQWREFLKEHTSIGSNE